MFFLRLSKSCSFFQSYVIFIAMWILQSFPTQGLIMLYIQYTKAATQPVSWSYLNPLFCQDDYIKAKRVNNIIQQILIEWCSTYHYHLLDQSQSLVNCKALTGLWSEQQWRIIIILFCTHHMRSYLHTFITRGQPYIRYISNALNLTNESIKLHLSVFNAFFYHRLF